MKRTVILVMLLALIVVSGVSAQQNIPEYILYLEKPVPENFVRINRTTYMEELGGHISLTVQNNIVKTCMIGSVFEYSHEAYLYLAFYYNYFENDSNGWNYSEFSEDGLDIYTKDGVYAFIRSPSKRDDGLIGAAVLFTSQDFYFSFGTYD